VLYLFLAGILIRMLVEHLNAQPASPLRARLSFALFAVSVSYLLVGPDWLNEDSGSPLKGIIVLVLRDVAVMAFFVSCVLGAPVLRRLLNWKPLAFVGLISYSMFLFHLTVLLFVRRGILREEWFSDWVAQSALLTWVGFLLYFILGYAVIGFVSYLGFRFIESPFLRLKPK
jgi:peptidoglycan/LPS O-acetylase OafA/YrhL